jgi:hypothetical protein
MMRLYFLAVCLLSVTSAASAQAQVAPSTCPVDSPKTIAAFQKLLRDMPQKGELIPLLTKTDEKIVEFEKSILGLKADIERVDPGATAKITTGAAAAHQIIAQMLSDGHTAGRLVALLPSLDDFTRHASRESLLLVLNGIATNSPAKDISGLASVGNSLYDISDLLLHTTLRAVNSNDAFIGEMAEALR